MDSADRALLLGIVGTIALLVSGIGSCTCVQNWQDDTAMVRMVEHGTDALAARCAVRGVQSDGSCAIIAARTSH